MVSLRYWFGRSLYPIHDSATLIAANRFLRAEPSPEMVESMGPLNHHIHAVVAELLQVIISRGESDIVGLKSLESALTSRLYLCVHRSELDLQNKLLHVLHSVVHAISGIRRSDKASADLTGKLEAKARDLDNLAQPPSLSRDAMFVKVLSDAISTQQNSAVVHHWIDFLLMTIPQIRHSLNSIVLPLVDCLVLRLGVLVQAFSTTYGPTGSLAPSSTEAEATDAEYTVLMNALERLLLIAVSEARAATADIEPRSPDQRSMTESNVGGTGLLGYMTGVLASAEVETVIISEEAKVCRFVLLSEEIC